MSHIKEEEGKITIRLDLKGEMLRRFQKIKERYGFENNTDVLRLLITKAYEEIVKG